MDTAQSGLGVSQWISKVVLLTTVFVTRSTLG